MNWKGVNARFHVKLESKISDQNKPSQWKHHGRKHYVGRKFCNQVISNSSFEAKEVRHTMPPTSTVKILSQNYQDINNFSIIRVLWALIKCNNPSVLFLNESKATNDYIQFVTPRIGFHFILWLKLQKLKVVQCFFGIRMQG